MRMNRLTLLLFALYCFEVGLFLAIVPWSPLWLKIVAQIPSVTLQDAASSALARSALTGFGLVHLVWSLHDLLLAFRRRGPEEVAPGGPAAHDGATETRADETRADETRADDR